MTSKTALSFFFPEATIKGNVLLWIKTLWAIWNFLWRWIGMLLIIVLATPIWLPISVWKTGLIVSDHIMKSITND